MGYDYVLSTLDGVKVSELAGAASRTLSAPLRGVGSATARVRRSSPDALRLLECKGILHVYETDDTFTTDGSRRLIAAQRLVAAEEVGDEQGVTVAATFADPFWTLLRRFTATGDAGDPFPRSYGTPTALIDRISLIAILVDAANVKSGTGLHVRPLSVSSSGTYLPNLAMANVGELVQQLCSTLDSPEYRVTPKEFGKVQNDRPPSFAYLDVGTLSQHRPNAAFEYGDGRLNVKSFRRAVSLDRTVNRFWQTAPGWPEATVQAGYPPAYSANTVSMAALGYLEGTGSNEILDGTLRQAIADTNIIARNSPQQTIAFDPVQDLGGRVPKYLQDFALGDTLPFRAWTRVADPVTRELVLTRELDTIVRVYGFSLALDENGTGTPTITVSPTA